MVAVLSLVFGGVGAYLINAFNARNAALIAKNNAETQKKDTDGRVANQVSEAWQKYNKPLEEQIEKLGAEIEEMKEREGKHLRIIGELIRGTNIQANQLRKHELVSDWQPSGELVPLFEEITTAQAIGDKTKTTPDHRFRNDTGLGRRQ